jgi:site-specific DNA-methyltransferase (adenine-specific)
MSDPVTICNIKLHLEDCMDVMCRYPDDYFDLALVDPPYGINWSSVVTSLPADRGGQRHQAKNWDDEIPSAEYFVELQRVSKNQIIWGGNYFPPLWVNGCRGFIFWFKQSPLENFSDGELAWTSFDKVAKQCDYRYYGSLEGNTSAPEKIHPTQKPVGLYDWLLKNYAEPGCKVIDTHLGSGSSAISAHYFGVDEFVGCEMDEDYFKSAVARVTEKTRQMTLFDTPSEDPAPMTDSELLDLL